MNESNKLISIIIATYNVEKIISDCLESIKAEKTEEIELIIVDGQSKDNSIKIIETYKDTVDILISEPDKGLYDAWNKGIKKATGEWIMFLGADDRLLKNKLTEYLSFVKKHANNNVDLFTAKAEYLDLNNKLIKIIGENFIWDHYKQNMLISHGSTLHNRKLFEEYGNYDINYKICADYEFLMRKGKNIKSIFYPHAIFQFKIGGASFSIACQKESYLIRKKYKTITSVSNILIFIKRSLGILLKSTLYKVK